LLKGDSRPSRQHFEPEPRPVEPECPSWLTPLQRQYWRWAETELRAMGTWVSADSAAIGNLAIGLATLEVCNDILATEGLFIDGQKHNRVRHPALIARNQAQLLVKGLLRELGLSPVGRSQLPTARPKPDKLGPERLFG
jgi:P27 family predicted phage terminase small subunit